MTHTPTPWRYPGLGVQGGLIWGQAFPVVPIALAFSDRVITPAEAEANAEFIVRAVNAHDELQARCAYLEAINKELVKAGMESLMALRGHNLNALTEPANRLEAVLAKAQALMEKEVKP